MSTGEGTITPLPVSGAGAGLTYWEILSRVANYMGIGRTPKDNNLTDVMEVLEDGYQRFLECELAPNPKLGYLVSTPHEWSFLRPQATLTLVADTYEYTAPSDFGAFYSRPTYPVGTSLPPLIVVSTLNINNRRSNSNYTANPQFISQQFGSFGSTTGDSWQFLVYPTASQVYALTYRYQVQTGKFATPISSGSGTFSNTTVDFDSITDSSATFSTDGVAAGDKVVVVSAASAVAGIHEVASVTSETQIKLTTSPPATDASTCTYDVYDNIIYHKGGRMHDQTVVEMCMAVAEERHMEGVTVHRQLASRQLMRSIGRDKRFTAQQIGGSLGRRSPLEPPVTYVSNID